MRGEVEGGRREEGGRGEEEGRAGDGDLGAETGRCKMKSMAIPGLRDKLVWTVSEKKNAEGGVPRIALDTASPESSPQAHKSESS